MEYDFERMKKETPAAEEIKNRADASPAPCDSNARERRGYSTFRRAIAHIQLMLSVIVLTCFIIDKFNSSMEFMESALTKALVAALAVFTMATAIMTISAYWPREEK